MTSPQSKSRGPEEWREVFSEFEQSQLTVAKFCEQRGISVAMYYYWRKRIAPLEGPGADLPARREFIDLSQFSNDRAARWSITLRLGEGMELVLSQQ